jgi:hypothetical protein
VSVVEVYQEAARRGLTLRPMGPDRLAVIPARLCSPAFVHTLRAHKAGLLALLTEPKTTRSPEIVRPNRPLTNRELWLLRREGPANDPIIITALNLFNARIVGIKAASLKRCKPCRAEFHGGPESKFCSPQCWQKSLLEPLDEKARLKSCLNYLRDFEARLERMREEREQTNAEL